jgi:hypothetical protein
MRWYAILVGVLTLVSLAACDDGADGDADVDGDVDGDGDGDGDGDSDGDGDGDGDADGDGDGDADGDGDTDWVDPPTTTVPLVESDEIILNPERGFYEAVDLLAEDSLGWVRDEGMTLAHAYIRLDDWRTTDLPASLMDDLAAGVEVARQAGIEIILRFSYNFGPYPDSEPDAPEEWVLAHIAQLAPVLEDNADAIAVMQAGFIGAWGEWHTSTNGLLDDPATKFEILEAILGALPPERFVQLRYPPYKQEGYGGPVTTAEAFTDTPLARVGHHNDCFLASDDDWGTYPTDDIEGWKDYVAADTVFVPMGGETCNPNPPRSECATALAEMERLHYTYINFGYHQDVVASWTAGGCRDEMERRLGYRLVALDVTTAEAAPPGGVLPLTVRLENRGFAAPINPRPVIVVLDGPTHHEAEVPGADVRWWAPARTESLSLRLQLPADLAPGSYSLGLRLPAASPRLRDDPRAAIRLANDGTWNDATGVNALGTVQISATAPGSVDPAATEFFVIIER